MRVLPNMTVLAPADEVELRQSLQAALKLKGPVYMRIGKKVKKLLPRMTINLRLAVRLPFKKVQIFA